MGRSGKKSGMVLGFLGLTSPETETAREDGADQWLRRHHHQQCHGAGAARSKVRPSDDDGHDGRRRWYAEPDIDRRASEFIDRVHRRIMLAGDDEPTPR
ncbi:hypothetical protein ACP70R_048401 [Stipagrostis hirtigluma subsp. patula]